MQCIEGLLESWGKGVGFDKEEISSDITITVFYYGTEVEKPGCKGDKNKLFGTCRKAGTYHRPCGDDVGGNERNGTED